MIPTTDEGLTYYLNAIGQFRQLTVEEERTATREELILSNLRLAVHIAKAYAYNVDDLIEKIQDANVGLIQAADAFDPDRAKFSVCASFYIKASIRNRLTDDFGKPLRRREYARTVTSIEVLEGFDPANDDNPAEMTSQVLMLQAASRVLTQKQRTVVQSRLNGMTHQEVANQIGSTYQNVQQLERSALKKIQAL